MITIETIANAVSLIGTTMGLFLESHKYTKHTSQNLRKIYLQTL